MKDELNFEEIKNITEEEHNKLIKDLNQALKEAKKQPTTIKLIGRISQKTGKEYFQHAYNLPNGQSKFIPVFFKKCIGAFNRDVIRINKVDKNNVGYVLYEVPYNDIWFPIDRDCEVIDGIKIPGKGIITKGIEIAEKGPDDNYIPDKKWELDPDDIPF